MQVSDSHFGPRYPGAEDFIRGSIRQLTRLAVALSGSQAKGEDLVASSIAACLPHWNTISGSRFSYVRRAVVNAAINAARHESLIIQIPVADVHEGALPSSGDDVADRVATGQDIKYALEQLSPRAVLVLRFLEDLSTAEAARLLNKPVGTIKRQTHEALIALRANGALDQYARPSRKA